MSQPIDLGAFRASSLRHYGVSVPAEDLAELSQTVFDAMHTRAREDCTTSEAKRICERHGWEENR